MTPLSGRTIDTAHESHHVFDRAFPTAETMKQACGDEFVKTTREFPDGFYWGTATASCQIEVTFAR